MGASDLETGRPDLADLAPAEIGPLEALIAGFPAVWQDLARSHYCTLLGCFLPGPRARVPDRLAELARLAADLARGIATDLGGVQVYIPVGAFFAAGGKAARVVQAWRAGQPWAVIARTEHITDRRAQQIVAAWRREQFARAQMTLPMDDEDDEGVA
jgi:hypothetical protein